VKAQWANAPISATDHGAAQRSAALYDCGGNAIWKPPGVILIRGCDRPRVVGDVVPFVMEDIRTGTGQPASAREALIRCLRGRSLVSFVATEAALFLSNTLTSEQRP